MRPPRLGSNFRKVWIAATVSSLGDGAFVAAFPLLAATMTRDPALVAGVVFAERLPWMLFAVISGALVDRLDRRLVMAYVDATRTVVTAALAIIILYDSATIPLLYAFAFALGTAQTLFDSASQAILPSIVKRDELERANARLMASSQLATEFAGPPLGSFLFAALAALPFLVDAGSFAVAAVLVFFVRGVHRPVRAGGTASNLRGEIREGFVWLVRHPLLRALAAMLGLWNLLDTAVWSIFVLFALEVLGLSAAGYGVLLSAAAIGGLLGAAVATRISRWLGPGRALLAMISVSVVAYGVMGLVANRYVVATMLALTSLAALTWNVITVSLRQSIIPDNLLGRVNSIYRFVGWGTMPLGAAIGGLLARSFGLRAPFLVAGGVLAVAVLAVRPFIDNAAIAEARAVAQ